MKSIILLPIVMLSFLELEFKWSVHVIGALNQVPVADPGFRKGRFHSNTNAWPGLTCMITEHSNFHDALL